MDDIIGVMQLCKITKRANELEQKCVRDPKQDYNDAIRIMAEHNLDTNDQDLVKIVMRTLKRKRIELLKQIAAKELGLDAYYTF